MNKLWAWLATMPSTNARIALTLLLMFGTGVRVIVFGWTPPWEWVTTLTLWAGLDIAQFGTKRTTDSTYVAAKTSGEPPKDPPPEPKPPEIGV